MRSIENELSHVSPKGGFEWFSCNANIMYEGEIPVLICGHSHSFKGLPFITKGIMCLDSCNTGHEGYLVCGILAVVFQVQ